MHDANLQSPELIVTPGVFLDRVRSLAQSANTRILLETMVFDNNGDVADLTQDMIDASRRGVDVKLVMDKQMSFQEALCAKGMRGVRQLSQSVAAMSDAAISVVFAGKPSFNPFAKRHHAKTYLFDDMVLTAGGVNLCDESMRRIDYMLEYHDKRLADLLFETLPDVAISRPADKEITLDKSNSLLIDGGTAGSSLILDRTLENLKGANRVWYVSQMMPDPELEGALMLAGELHAYYNSLNTSSLVIRLATMIDNIRCQIPNSYIGTQFIHAKFCVVEYGDGKKRAITGSHNFNARGVAWGTQELALDSTDQDLCKRLIAFAESLNQ